MNTKKNQYNGLILIAGYLQRLFVAESIYAKLRIPTDPARMDTIKGLINKTQPIINEFEATVTLREDQQLQCILVLDEINKLMKGYFKPLVTNFNEKLAIFGSSLYAEQMVNNGIIKLGKLFNVEINRDFEMRSKFYADRTKMIDYLVHTIENNQTPDMEFMTPIEPWYENIMRNKEGILEDIQKIYDLLK